MPLVEFDESLIQRMTPWEACASLEEFFEAGGHCSVTDKTNWIGNAFSCAMKAEGSDSAYTDLQHAIAWAHLAISIRESLANSYPPQESWGIICGAMWIRTKMIVQFGSHIGDSICDPNRIVNWCLSTPEVQKLLKAERAPLFEGLEPEVTSVAEILKTLISTGRLNETGDVAKLMRLIREISKKKRA